MPLGVERTMPVIRIDKEVYDWIWEEAKKHNIPFPSPNKVLRHILFDEPVKSRRSKA